MMRSAVSRATSVPLNPIATPTWAARSAGASLAPSPLTATKWPFRCRDSTMSSFWCGPTRANTRALRVIWSIVPESRASFSSGPLTNWSARSIMSNSFAIASAVAGWSPVIIATSMPACRQATMAAFASVRRGSIIPTRPISVSPCRCSSVNISSAPSSISPAARASTLCPSLASV